MQVDILDLKNFYHHSLGTHVRKAIAHALQELEVNLDDKATLCYGYAIPYLSETDASFGFMPAAQGIMAWPSKKNKNALVYENALPLASQSVNTIVVIHGFEFCHFPEAFLKECWRVLKPEGRVILIVPNRRGIWAHRDHTPLGVGHPYTMTQLTRLLKKNKFDTCRKLRPLYKLPINNIWARLLNLILEKIGPKIMANFSGLVAVEAIKEVYQPSLVGMAKRALKEGLVPSHFAVQKK